MKEIENEYMLDGFQLLIDKCREFDYKILEVKIDNENKIITMKIEGLKWKLVFEDGTWDFK